MIADFNKQMESLQVRYPEDVFPRLSRSPSHGSLGKVSPKHQARYPTTLTQQHGLLKAGSDTAINKAVSPVIEHTLQHQQLLLQQQQALIELKKDQQAIQKALQDQLKLQTLQTQMQIDQQNKAQAVKKLPLLSTASTAVGTSPLPTPTPAKKEVVSTGTEMSVPGTPKCEEIRRDWRADKKREEARNRKAVSPEKLKDNWTDDPRNDARRQKKEDYRSDLRRDEHRNVREPEYSRKGYDQDHSRGYDRDREHTSPSRSRRREDTYRSHDYRDRDGSPDRRTREDSISPPQHRDRTPERKSTSGDRYQKKDRRRLPQPSVEEMQASVETSTCFIPKTSPPSVLKKSGYPSSISALKQGKSQLPQIPATIIPSAASLPGYQPNYHHSISQSSIHPQIIVPPPSAVPSQAVSQAPTITVIDQRSMSPGLLITSYPVQVVSPAVLTTAGTTSALNRPFTGTGLSRSFSPPVSSFVKI